MPTEDLNKFDDIAHLMTEEERQALKDLEAEGGFEQLGDTDVFEDEDVRQARLSQIEREKEEAEKDGDFTTAEDEAAAKAADATPDGEPAKAPEGETPPDGAEAKAEDDAKAQEAAPEPEPKPQALPAADVLQRAMEAADAQIEARIAELAKQLDEVEITSEQFTAAVAEANAARRALVSSEVANINFQQTTSDYLNQYPGLRTPQHVEGLNAEFEMIDNSPMFAKLSDADKLALAHERYNNTLTVAKSHGLAVPDPIPLKSEAKPEPKPDPTPVPPKKAELAPKPAAPKTLAKMPASDTASPGEGRATQLRALVDSNDPDAIQSAMLDGSISIRDLENM